MIRITLASLAVTMLIAATPALAQTGYGGDTLNCKDEMARAEPKMNAIEEASARRGTFEFPFAQLESQKYRLTKGALYPILAASRNCIEINPRTNEARWLGGYDAVEEIWQEAGAELVRETYQATRDIGRMPDQLGKNRSHWTNLHKTLELRVLRRQIRAKN